MVFFSQKNQQLSTIDLLVLFLLFGTVTSAFGAILAESFQDNRLSRARSTAEALALQILVQNRVNRAIGMGMGERGPASVGEVEEVPNLLISGEIGRDPWGRPFHYRVQPIGTHGHKRRVFVWSDGPNKRSDSDAVLSLATDSLLPSPLNYLGDDVGSIQEGPGDS